MKRRVLVGVLASVLMAWGTGSAFGEAEFKIKVGYVVPESYPHHIAMRDVFKPYVEKESGGRVEVELFPNGQLGGDRELVEGVQLGVVEIALPATGVVAGFEPKLQVLDLPYLLESREHAYKALDGDVGQKLLALLPAQGIRGLGFAEVGFRHFTNNKGPVTKAEDLKGTKIRTLQSPIYMDTFNAIGASPANVAFGELYSALQTGLVDGEDNPINVIAALKLYEVQKYLTLSGHAYGTITVLVGDKFFTSLPEDLQKVLAEGAKKFCEAQRQIAAQQEVEKLSLLKEKGMQVNELTSEEREAFKTAVKPVYEKLRNDLGAEFFDGMLSAIAASK